jgi:hypothetical protein
MKPMSSLIAKLGLSALVIVLSGCAATQETQRRQGHAGSGQGMETGRTMGAHGHRMENMDMQQMCEMHNKMMSEKSLEEKKAMMEAHQGKMSPEMMQRHMAMMDEKCKPTK